MEIMSDEVVMHLCEVVIMLAAEYPKTYSKIMKVKKLNEAEFDGDILNLVRALEKSRQAAWEASKWRS